MPDIDVLIPTGKQRLHNLLFQIRAVLNQGLDVRVTIAMNGDYPELLSSLSPDEKVKIRFVTDAPAGNIGNPAVLYCMETLDWADWYYQIGDDDAVLPWGLRHLWEGREGASMVVGRGWVVNKNGHDEHGGFTGREVGRIIQGAKISGGCVLFNFRDIEKLHKPWWNEKSPMADFELIHRMAGCYPHRMISSVVFILCI